MLDAKKLLDQFVGGQGDGRGAGDFLRGAGGGVLAGGLAALLMGSKTGRKIGGEALKLGGMAAVGALAYKAYSDWQAGKKAEPVAEAASHRSVPMLPAPAGTPFNPATEFGQQSLARHMLRAMIAAAKADGTVDATERRAIAQQLDAAGLEADERDFVLADFDKPMTPEGLAKQATDPMLRARLYAAAVAAMGEVTAPERDWLDRLAKAMKLDRAAAAAIEERLQG